MQSSIPCIPPAAWPRRKPSSGKKTSEPIRLAVGPRIWVVFRPVQDPTVGVVQKETSEQHRSPEEVIRRRVDLARRCSRGSGRPYGSLAARASQNQWLLTGHPRLVTVKGRMLFFLGLQYLLLFCSSKRSLLDEVLLPFILPPPDRASTPSASICARGGSESSPR